MKFLVAKQIQKKEPGLSRVGSNLVGVGATFLIERMQSKRLYIFSFCILWSVFSFRSIFWRRGGVALRTNINDYYYYC